MAIIGHSHGGRMIYLKNWKGEILMKNGAMCLAAAALLVGSVLTGDAWAKKGKLTLMNCSGTKLTWCSYDKGDLVMRVPNRSGPLNHNEYQSKVGCDSNGGCKVLLIPSGKLCEVVTKNEVYVPATALGEYAYWIKKGKDGKYLFEKASDDRAYFDNRSCPK